MDDGDTRGTWQTTVARARAMSKLARAASASSRAASASSRARIGRAADCLSRSLGALGCSRPLFDGLRPRQRDWEDLDFLDRRQAWIEQTEIDREIRITEAAARGAG